MEKWNLIKEQIEKHKELSNNMDNWMFRYDMIKNNFNTMSKNELIDIAIHDKDFRVKEIALNRIKIIENYLVRKDFNNVVTLKLFIPSGCNARCEFCYMKDYLNTEDCNNKKIFLDNFLNSITEVINGVNGAFPISLDITGNEPTYDYNLLIEVLNKLKNYKLKDKICRTTIATNGFQLKKVLNNFRGVIDYVNISVHDYDYNKRNSIFGTKTLNDFDYMDIVLSLHNIGIDCSAVCVLYKEIDGFKYFTKFFIQWCKEIGFKNIRFRNDVFWKNSKFNEYKDIIIADKLSYHVIQQENTNDSNWCRISDNEGFFVFFLDGVKDTSVVSKGIEYVINDDGRVYTDFYKRQKLEDYEFPMNFIFDKINIDKYN